MVINGSIIEECFKIIQQGPSSKLKQMKTYSRAKTSSITFLNFTQLKHEPDVMDTSMEENTNNNDNQNSHKSKEHESSTSKAKNKYGDGPKKKRSLFGSLKAAKDQIRDSYRETIFVTTVNFGQHKSTKRNLG